MYCLYYLFSHENANFECNFQFCSFHGIDAVFRVKFYCDLLCYVLFVQVEFGARMINIEGKQIKLQIWDTVSQGYIFLNIILSFQNEKRKQKNIFSPLTEKCIKQIQFLQNIAFIV